MLGSTIWRCLSSLGLLLNMMPGTWTPRLYHAAAAVPRTGGAGSVAALGIGTGTMVACAGCAAAGTALPAEYLCRAVRRHQADGALYLVYLGISPARAGLALRSPWNEAVALLQLSWRADLPGRVAHQCVTIPRWRSSSSPSCPQFIPISRCAAEGAGLHPCWAASSNSQRHDLVPSAGVFHRVCKPQGAIARPLAANLAEIRVMGGLFVGLGSKLAAERRLRRQK